MNEVHIPTIKGNNVLTISNGQVLAPKVYKSRITQVGTNNPTEIVIIDEIGMTGWQRFAAGTYANFPAVPFDEKFAVGLGSTNVASNGMPIKFADLTAANGGILTLITSTLDSSGAVATTVLTDDVMNGEQSVVLELHPARVGEELTDEEKFNIILSKLDANQLSLWDKTIMRDNLIVIEVDGNVYRKTGDFSQSSKVIES
jgi:hypothetical protein